MIQFAIAAGVIVGASVVSWYYNQKTDEEKGRQERAWRERDDIRDSFHRATSSENARFSDERRNQAQRHRKLLLNEIKENSTKVSPISEGLTELYNVLKDEIIADTTSPYRRSALQREYSRTQDAQVRLEEYKKYLDFEKRLIEQCWNNEDYDGLINLNVSEPLLPMEWLYPGKLLIVELKDIGTSLPKFSHRLLFSRNREQQQALALNIGDEFPILVESSGKIDGDFWGCVAKGLAFYNHIQSVMPVEMTIERFLPKDRAYRGSLFNGVMTVDLPEMKLLNPDLRCVPGQRVEVFFDRFDATLSGDPSRKPNNRGRLPPVTVSAKPPSLMGENELQLYITVDENQLSSITDDNFFSEDTNWTLLDFNYETQEVLLAKSNVQVTCCPTSYKDGLEVIQVRQKQTPQIGVDLPFDFLLVSQELNPQELFSWPYGIEQFYDFASQACIDKDAATERLQQVEFFKRWQHVINYQKQHESERSVELSAILLPLESRQQRLVIPREAYWDSEATETVGSLFKQIEKSNGSLNPMYCCRIYRWSHEKESYIPALKMERRNDVTYNLTTDGDFEVDGHFFLPRDGAEIVMFKFVVSLPNSSLQRQQQALDALFEDRMVEPRLKDIFLSPKSYQPQYINYWLNDDINWHGNLTKSQKEVVSTALSAKHIAMVQGPPGTGKTTTIVEMLYQLVTHNPNQRILVVSQQNTAVDNAITKFKKEFPQLISSSVNIVRIGNPDKLDDAMAENHFDTLYQDFLDERIQHVNQTAHLFEGGMQESAYEWAALLRQMQSASDNRRVSDEFFTAMLVDKNLIGATCVGLAARKAGVDHLDFDVAIVDEAGRATVPELLIPLLRSRKAILIGDHHQLPPSIAPVLRDDSAKEEMAFLKDTFLESSFFEVLYEQLPDECTASLKEQFRMASPIGDLVAELFYTRNGERQLFNGKGETTDTSDFTYPECLRWVDVKGKQNRPKNSTSIENFDEAKAICTFLQELAIKQRKPIDVAVITPYGAQKRRIRQLLIKGGIHQQHIKLGNLNIKVDTVDSFQGSEAELVCYSTVRTKGSLQFLLDRKRLNVACSRAQENLVFFGHRNVLEKWKPRAGEKNFFSEIIKRAKVIPYRSNEAKKKRDKTFSQVEMT